jgi:hypothetical protein
VQLEVVDVEGNVTRCDPVIATLRIPDGAASVRAPFRDIPAAERFLTVQNGEPGLTRLRVRVNGAAFAVVELGPGEVLTMDLGPALQAGKNRVVFKAWGEPGATALIVLADGHAGDRELHLSF